MLPSHFHDAAGDLFTIVEKFWDCPKFYQCSCHIVLCSLNSCYIRLVLGIFRNLLLYCIVGLLGSSCSIFDQIWFYQS